MFHKWKDTQGYKDLIRDFFLKMKRIASKILSLKSERRKALLKISLRFQNPRCLPASPDWFWPGNIRFWAQRKEGQGYFIYACLFTERQRRSNEFTKVLKHQQQEAQKFLFRTSLSHGDDGIYSLYSSISPQSTEKEDNNRSQDILRKVSFFLLPTNIVFS